MQEPEGPGDQIAAALPRAAAQGDDLTGADGLSLMRVLSISEPLNTAQCLAVATRGVEA